MMAMVQALPAGADPSGTDAQACAELRGLVEGEVVPTRIDAVTEGRGTTLSCPLRTLVYNKAVSVSFAQVPDGWRDFEQQAWNRRICNAAAFGPMARRGWTFTENWSFANGVRILIDAHCPPAEAPH
jgi:hypothetical protein